VTNDKVDDAADIARKGSWLKNFLFGEVVPEEESQYRVENVCDSAAIFSIKRSWVRDEKSSPIESTEPMQECKWAHPDPADQEEDELKFLNECYRRVKKKMKVEREKKPGQEASEEKVADNKERDESMDLPIFNGAKYLFKEYFVLDDDQMKNYPWRIRDDAEEDDQADEKEVELTDETQVGGAIWRVLKRTAMKSNYKSELWFKELEDEDKKLLEKLRDA